jgi:hypothetical protein
MTVGVIVGLWRTNNGVDKLFVALLGCFNAIPSYCRSIVSVLDQVA